MTTRPEILASRTTADGVEAYVWSDGRITDRMHRYVRGGSIPAKVLWLVVGSLCSWDYADLPELIAYGRRAATRRIEPAAGDFICGAVRTAPPAPKTRAGFEPCAAAHMIACRALNCGVCGHGKNGRTRRVPV